MSIKNIMCPVDFSEHGDAALAYATSLAKEYGAELHLVHVFEEPVTYVDGGFANAPAVPVLDPETERKRLDEVTPPQDVAFRRKLLVGHPANELVAYARDEGIDLVVMGTHGRTGLSRLLMGSVAEAIVRQAPCPVLTIKQPSSALQEST